MVNEKMWRYQRREAAERSLLKRLGRVIECSFCGAPEGRPDPLVAGPGVYICKGCVELCVEILEQKGAEAKSRVARFAKILREDECR